MNGVTILFVYAVIMILATVILTKKEKNVERLENEFPADLFTPPEDKEPESVAEAGTDTEEDDVLTKELNSKTVAELKEYASARGIDTTGLSKKADLVQHIFSEQKKADEARALLRGE